MYIIKRYNAPLGKPHTIFEEFLSESGDFCIATSKTRKFATIGHAVAHWHAIQTHYYKPQVWIEGPRKGRYEPITGKRIR